MQSLWASSKIGKVCAIVACLQAFKAQWKIVFQHICTMQGVLWRVLFPGYKLEIAVIFLVLFNLQLNEILQQQEE